MRFVPNPKFAQEIEREVEFRAGKVRVGEEVVTVAKSIAPYDAAHKATPQDPHYRDTIEVKIEGPRVWVTTTGWTGHFIEWGTVDTPTFAVIRRACRQVGLNVNEVGRGGASRG
jgi:hypothetical protein